MWILGLKGVKMIKGLFTWTEDDPRRLIILAPDVFCIQFTCKNCTCP